MNGLEMRKFVDDPLFRKVICTENSWDDEQCAIELEKCKNWLKEVERLNGIIAEMNQDHFRDRFFRN
jgi:hypothetical protein